MFGSELRAKNALRNRILPERLFIENVREGGTHHLYKGMDTDSFVEIALDNNKNSKIVRDYILARLSSSQEAPIEFDDF